MTRPYKWVMLIALFGLFSAGCIRNANLVETALVLPVVSQTDEVESSEAPQPSPVRPENTTTPTGATRESQPEDDRQIFAVTFLAEGEILNVRSGPGVMNEVVGSLTANQPDLVINDKQEAEDGVVWFQVEPVDGETGWVSGDYLTEQVTAEEMCTDPQVGAMLDQFVSAVRDRDGTGLKTIVSPRHGLTILYNVWNPAVSIPPDVISGLFSSTTEYDWGIHDGSGDPIVGPFNETILPQIENVVLENHTRQCNTLENNLATGPTAGLVFWPYDFRSLNYVALYRPAPADQEMDWRTWAAGIEYIDGKPFLVVLVQFDWEI